MVASSKGQGSEKTISNDDPILWVGGVVVLYAVCWFVWYLAHAKLAMAYTYVRYVQVWAAYAAGELLPGVPGVAQVHDWFEGFCQPSGLFGRCARDFSTVKWSEIAGSSMYANAAWLAVLLVICVKLFLRINKTHPMVGFGRKHDIRSFVREQSRMYPHLRVFPHLGLIEKPLDDPVFGMSLTCRQFAFRHRLICGWKDSESGTLVPTLDRDRASLILREQLGPLWTSAVHLSNGELLLAAIVLPRVAATSSSMSKEDFDRAMARSNAMLTFCWNQFVVPADSKPAVENWSWLTPDIDLTEPQAVVDEYVRSPEVQRLIRAHAFKSTVLYALLVHARALGTLPPCDMRWMRFYDRRVWYLVSTVGRQSPFPEAQAVHCHYLYEAKAKGPIYEPQMDKALTGFDAALSSYRFTDKERRVYEGKPESTTSTS